MINLSRTKHIQRSFSRAARNYEAYSEMHRSLSRRIIKMIPQDKEYDRILDIGQGTGWMAHQIKRQYPRAHVVGMDLALGMASLAKKKYNALSIVQASAEQLPFKDSSFDLVTSNLVYQWLDNLEEGFKLMRSVLKGQGVSCITLFGRQTFPELFDALVQSSPETSREHMARKVSGLRRLPDRKTVEEAVAAAGFGHVEFEYFTQGMRFEDLFGVLKWIKAIGANALERNFYLGRNQLFRADQYYRRQYGCRGGVRASFEVFIIRARS